MNLLPPSRHRALILRARASALSEFSTVSERRLWVELSGGKVRASTRSSPAPPLGPSVHSETGRLPVQSAIARIMLSMSPNSCSTEIVKRIPVRSGRTSGNTTPQT
jgi:hypothetical protein